MAAGSVYQPAVHAGPPGTEVVIAPPGRWTSLDLGEIWRYRELIYFLAWRDVKIRYKQTLLGIAWVMILPIVNMIIFTIIFGNVARLPSEGIPYPIFTFAALLPWTYLSYVLLQSGQSVVQNASMVSKVYFPRIVLPLASALGGLVDFGAAFLLLIALMLWYHVHIGPAILLLPFFVLMTMAVALAVGLWLAALNVLYRDIKYVIPVLTQIWLYVSPVAYSAKLVKGKLAIAYMLNPMAATIQGFRWAILGITGPSPRSVLIALAVTVVLFASAVVYFRRMEERFADVI